MGISLVVLNSQFWNLFAVRADEQGAAFAEPALPKQRWEYLVVALPIDSDKATAQINKLADEGWEYVGLVNTSNPASPGIYSHDSSIVMQRPKTLKMPGTPQGGNANATKAPFNVPGAIEGESMTIANKSSDFPIIPQDMAAFADGQWSGNSQLFGKAPRAGAWADLELPAPADGNYQIVVYLTKAADYGIIEFHVNGAKLGKPVDCFHADSVVSTGAIELGEAKLKKGVNKLRVEAHGTAPKSRPPHYSWGLDCLELKQAKQ
jgi:hypothetical protein